MHGRSPGSRLSALSLGLPDPFPGQWRVELGSPLTVAGAATVLVPDGYAAPCSLLIKRRSLGARTVSRSCIKALNDASASRIGRSSRRPAPPSRLGVGEASVGLISEAVRVEPISRDVDADGVLGHLLCAYACHAARRAAYPFRPGRRRGRSHSSSARLAAGQSPIHPSPPQRSCNSFCGVSFCPKQALGS